ncbi:MAG: DNA helicase-2/ATP-dependent DNA helicase PcrA, partial [Flavobacteriales bacterium]
EDLEEERRLFYVAITRAKKRALLSYAITRYRWGQLSQCEPSRFIEEIDPQYINIAPVQFGRQPARPSGDFQAARNRFNKPQQAGTPAPNAGGKALSKVASTSGPVNTEAILTIAEGTEVEHARFGKGKVIKIEGQSPNLKATVFFPTAGQKQLLLKFAKLKVI